MYQKNIRRRPSQEAGQGLVEYALILVLVSIVTVAVLVLFGDELRAVYVDLVIALGGTDPGEGSSEEEEESHDPQVVCHFNDANGTDGSINAEALVTDPDGNNTIDHVLFYIDGNFVEDEFVSRFCLGGGDSFCQNYNVSSLSPGSHTLLAVAYDEDGNTGQCTGTFTR